MTLQALERFIIQRRHIGEMHLQPLQAVYIGREDARELKAEIANNGNSRSEIMQMGYGRGDGRCLTICGFPVFRVSDAERHLAASHKI